MENVRCGKCCKLLAKAEAAVLEIKCPRCGTLNNVRVSHPKSEHRECLIKGDRNDQKSTLGLDGR